MNITKDKIYHKIARMLPDRLIYWCAIVLTSYGTTGKYSHTNPNGLNIMCALKRWEKK
jgi:hypothetical protein